MFKRKQKAVAASGYVGDLDPKQQDCLAKLKAHMVKKGNLQHDNPWFTDQYLLRFCRARKFEVKKVIQMWEEFIQTRVTNQVDELCWNFEYPERPQVMEHFSRGYYGVDRAGHPLFIDACGNTNVDGVLSITTEERFFQFQYHDYERCLKHKMYAMSHLTQMQINESTTIIDLQGFGIKKITKKVKALLGQTIKISSDNYPESMAMTLVINTPTSFKAVWAFVKGFLDEKQKKKIIITGSKYHDKLFKVIDPEQLPTWYGGKCQMSIMEAEQNAPWNQYELVDGPGSTPDQVGVRHKTTGELFTPIQMMSLKNPNVMGPGLSGTQGAMILQANGTYVPNTQVQVDDPNTLMNRDIDISEQNIEDLSDLGSDATEDKFEEEKQGDDEDPNFVNNMQKQQKEEQEKQFAQAQDADAYKMDL